MQFFASSPPESLTSFFLLDYLLMLAHKEALIFSLLNKQIILVSGSSATTHLFTSFAGKLFKELTVYSRYLYLIFHYHSNHPNLGSFTQPGFHSKLFLRSSIMFLPSQLLSSTWWNSWSSSQNAIHFWHHSSCVPTSSLSVPLLSLPL